MTPETVVPIAWEVLKDVALPIKDQFSYVMSSRSYAQKLEWEVGNLRHQCARVKNAVESARKDLGTVYSRVTEWQKTAEDALKEAQDLLNVFSETTKTCCYGTLPDPHYLYLFSRKANDRINDIRQVILQLSELKEIHFKRPVVGITLRGEGVFESRDSILSQIKAALDSNSKSVVGVCGMGGVGKSRFLEDAERRIREEMSFDLVIKAYVSKNPNIETIQDAIAHWLQLDISKIQNVHLRADILHYRLDNKERPEKKVLIILDDLWKKLDLKLVGIPCGSDNKVRGCKLLLASRDRKVLEREMCCDNVFRLRELPKEEAKILFERTVGNKALDDEFKRSVDKALQICAGLPLLIIEMAKLFKEGDSSELNVALNQTEIEMLKNTGIGKIINNTMQSSYDGLDGEDVKSFLQLCVVYGVPKPKRENLVRYGVGYVLDSECKGMKDARSSLGRLISILEASSLSIDNGEADEFKIHDLVCKFVALIASKNHPLLVWKDQDELAMKNKLKSCRAICFPYVDMELPKELYCPELLIFLLFSNNKSLEVPDSYFNYMRKLKVLDLTGVCLTHSPSSSTFQFPENLYTLCLDNCSLEDVSILGKLKGLKILSFVNSNIHRLPNEIGQLGELRLLDLNNCSQLQEIEPNVLGNLTKLEELYMENSFHHWNAELQTPQTNASLTELNNMSLSTLHISIPDPRVLPKDLDIDKLMKYRIQIGKVWDYSSYEVSKKLMLNLNQVNIIIKNKYIETTLGGTDDLYLEGVDKSVRSIYELSREGLKKLKHLQVENSSFIQYILRSPFHTFFEMLKSLLLKNLINLEKICYSRVISKSFDALEVVRVEECGKMKVLFPFPSVREFPKLKVIRVISCKLMQKILEVDDCGKVEFCNLRVLELCDLPNIKNFFTMGKTPSHNTSDDLVGTQGAFFYGQQESLTMKLLPNLKDIWSDESLLVLSNLQSLKVSWCESLLKVINFRSLVKLQKLHTLKVAHCVLVHEIFDLAESSADGNVEISSKLTTLYLKELPRLRCLWNKNPCRIVRFCYLKQLKVFGCNNLRFMFFSSMVKSLEQLRGLTVQNCKIMKAIIMEEEGSGMETSETLAFPMLTNLCFEHLESLTCFSHGKCSREVQSQDHIKLCSTALFNGEVAFPRLETLKISGMDNIKMIWDSKVAADSFLTLKSLCVNECSKIVNIGPSCIIQWLGKLERLEAKACGSVEVVFKPQPVHPLDVNDVACFPLKQLQLIELPELKCVWDKELFHQVEFQCSHSISISKCDSLKSLFSDSIAIDLMQLEESEIDECGNVELIENTSHASHWLASKTLEVQGYSETEILPLEPENEMPLHKQPPNLKGINVEDRGSSSRQLSMSVFSKFFSCIKTLEVSHCDGLSKMFTPAIAKNLNGLMELKISYCKILTEIISDEGSKDGHVVTFSQLKHMELDGLPRLRCFSLGKYNLEFPLLEHIIVIGCLNMKFFSLGPMNAPMVERVQVSRLAPYGEENLNIPFQNMFKEMAMVAGVKFMQFSDFPELIEIWHSDISPIKSSWQLESLVMDKCPFKTAIPSRLMLVLNNMRRLQVRDCDSLEEIFDLKGLEAVGSTLLLPKLQHLDLVNLQRLSRLWNKDLQGTLSFNSLGDLTLYNCSNLRHAFSPLMARCLTNLVRIDIKECRHIEGVIAEEEGQGSAVEKVTFPILSLMKLECLPNLTSFLSGKNYTLDCPRLEHLIIAHCPEMRSLTCQSLMEIDQGTSSLFTPQVQFRRLESMVISHMDNLSKIWTDDPQETFTFKYLRKVDAQNCKSLENLFPHWVATSLSQLEELRVESCGLREKVVRGDDTPHSSTAQDLFPKLTSLVLHDMPQLKSFYPKCLKWSSLKELRVTHCDKLNMSNFAASKNKSAQRDDHQDRSNKSAHSSFERDFPNLEKLLLVDKDIQMIQEGKLLDDFGEPKALTLACFHGQKAVFPSRIILERFHNLQSLEVFCSSFEDIFPEEGLADKGKHSTLENLRELKLSKLHNLKRVWREDYLVVKMLHSIKKFEVWDCPSLTTLFPVVTSFQNLMELVVKYSSGLIHLVTVSAVTNLVHLTDMTIVGCERMQEVVASDEKGEGKVISLGKLERLTLQHLPNLGCFSATTSFICRFPSLLSIEVEECPKMKIFSKHLLSTPNLEKVSLFKHKWQGNWEGDLNTTMQMLLE